MGSKRAVALTTVISIAVVCVWSAIAIASSNGPFDVPPTSWFDDAVYFVQSHGLMKYDNNGMFYPDAKVTRAELATVMMRAHQREFLLELLLCGNQNNFLDSAKVSEALKTKYSDALTQLCQSPLGPLATPSCSIDLDLNTGKVAALMCN